MQAEYGPPNIVSPTSSRTPKYIALGFRDMPSKAIVSFYEVFSFVVILLPFVPNKFFYFLIMQETYFCHIMVLWLLSNGIDLFNEWEV